MRPGLSSEGPHINADIPIYTNISSLTQQPQHPKRLLIGDSILHPINTKGLIRGLHKHSRGGATISGIINDIALYDLSQFQTSSVGGNDSAYGIDEALLEEKYDQLISIVKTGNAQCTLYICKIASRGDTDVTNLNSCIERLSVFINNTHSHFKDNNQYQYNASSPKMGYI